MKRFILVTVLLAAVSVLTVFPAQAVDLAGKWAVGARVSYADPIDDTVEGIDNDVDVTFSAAGVAPATSEFDVDVFTIGVGLKFLF